MHDLIIIGGGIAGFSAALYAARRGMSVLVVAKDVGGQANLTDLIENYPGIEAVGGHELVETVRSQAEEAGTEWLAGEVEKIKAASNCFVVTVSGCQYKCGSVILAFGKSPRDLKVSGETAFFGKGLSFCANCDMPLYRGKTVAIIGSEDLAVDTALLACRYAKKVFLVSDHKPKAHPALLMALSRKKKIQVVAPAEVVEVFGKASLSGIRVRTKDGKGNRTDSKLTVDGVFVELGYSVDSDFLAGLVEVDGSGRVKVKSDQSTSVPGIFAAGDSTDRPYKQAVISAGEGAAAALAAYDWLMSQRGAAGLTSDWTQVKRVK